jgi:DNA-binding transcriptional MerR regulator
MSIKTRFSIKDLENLSGIKAHTIRIWEKRYHLLEPERTDTNIRFYNQENLQKLLNVAYLNDNGHKISKIAELNASDINQKVREITLDNTSLTPAINAMTLSMLSFDQPLFENTYNQLLTKYSFRDLFLNVMVQLLERIGLLWQSNSIVPAHEHFISTLIRQKLLVNIERVQNVQTDQSKVFVLFLPINELHDIGLLYIHLELLLRGHKSVFLGHSVPLDNLKELQNAFDNITYITYFTVSPASTHALDFLIKAGKEVLSIRSESLLVLGRNSSHLVGTEFKHDIQVYKDIKDLLDKLE